MGKFKKLVNEKEVEIAGVKLTLRPLGGEYIEVFVSLSDEDKKISALIEIAKICIKNADPEITDEDLAELTAVDYMKVLPTVVELHGLN